MDSGMGSNTNRITGFASGMNIDQTVSDLMRAERQPLIKMEQEQMQMQYKMEDYREMNREYRSFSTSIFDNMFMRSSLSAKQTTSTNESLVSASAASDAQSGTFTVSNVTQLAEAASVQSSSSITGGSDGNVDPEASLADQFDDYNEGSTIEFGITTYNENGEAEKKEFSFEGSDSLNDVLSEVNRSDAGVSAFYDQQTGNISVTRSETGVFNEGGNEMAFEGDFLTNQLNLNSFADTEYTGAQNAEFTLNGIETNRRSNTFTENGIEITLNGTSAENGNSASLQVSPDTEGIKETVMNFVDEYNSLIEKTNDKLSEERDREYPPLTDDQRSEMSDEEISNWEEKSQSGYLRSDDILSNATTSMRRSLYDTVDTGGSFNQLTQLGITTTSNYQDGGKLEVDEDQLEQAISEDAESVYQLFASDGENAEDKGLARRLREEVDKTVDNISERAGGPSTLDPSQFTIGREMNQMDDEISDFERRMTRTENRYYDQFTRMEQAIAEANQQAQQIQQQLGGMGMM
ncbi:flagellar hook-associated protein 2 [Salibacterium qingdaonense]|uniref:Flagellar hook-associated protein 2 n=1 Tax=Salibacterium qingdaonense TaxID=266892 RepID=A0A1I4KZ04_9BACI|nr:flagellar hook-associated protein 2 [Salibacterium qingdaonense]SFL83970.1 flagellar hook-associated protein 2 [Salibacterium qingdaonense]